MGNKCSNCGKSLTPEEVEYYGFYCNDCETKDYESFLDAEEKESKIYIFGLDFEKLNDEVMA